MYGLIKKDTLAWVHNCVACQRAEIQKHVKLQSNFIEVIEVI